ncbi:MAG: hypothetical protein ACRC7O_05245 [Fimbriiglobus sp.]
MPATTPRPRSASSKSAPRKSAEAKKVESLLQELAYILHVTRKLNPATDWPLIREDDAAK